jgi:putative ABC transport system permease protein
MFSYYLRLAVKSIRRHMVLSGLMVSAIGIGIGACMTVITVYYMMSGDPIPHKSADLFAVQLNAWEGPGPYDQENADQIPELLTYTDAINLMESDIPDRAVTMHESGFTLDPANPDINPMLAIALFTTADFFAMFDVPFLYGGAWDEAADQAGASVAVIDFETNEEVFGGEDSVGQTLMLENNEVTVVGVLDRWEPVPRFYSAFNSSFGETNDVFIPLQVNQTWQKQNFGNTMCWGDTPMNSYDDFLNSECVWMEYWVELPTADQKAQFESYLSGYIVEQKKLGRFPIENAVAEIRNVTEWLEYNRVVSADFKVLVGLAIMFLAVCLLNTVALLLAKFTGDAPRVGLRRALGASKAMIFRQSLVEVGLIGVAGGVLGLALAWLGLQGVKAVNLGSYDQLATLDAKLVVFAMVVSLVAAVAAGLYPTWRICQVAPAAYLKTQ